MKLAILLICCALFSIAAASCRRRGYCPTHVKQAHIHGLRKRGCRKDCNCPGSEKCCPTRWGRICLPPCRRPCRFPWVCALKYPQWYSSCSHVKWVKSIKG